MEGVPIYTNYTYYSGAGVVMSTNCYYPYEPRLMADSSLVCAIETGVGSVNYGKAVNVSAG